MELPSLDHFDYRDYDSFYEPSDDTYLLLDALQAESKWLKTVVRPRVCMELGPGSGVVITALHGLLTRGEDAITSPLFLAVDINEAATAATARTGKANGLVLLEPVCADLGLCLQHRLSDSVDVLLFNPPYVPTPPEEVGTQDISAAWAGGKRGREVIDRAIPVMMRLLNPMGGCLYMVVVADNEPKQLKAMLESEYGVSVSTVLARRAKNEALSILKVVKGSSSQQARTRDDEQGETAKG